MCTHPLKGLVVGVSDITGKNIIKVVPEDYQFRDTDKVIPIPCGRCIECRLSYSRQWADRMMVEASKYSDNCFLTLTYSDENLPPPLSRCTQEGVLEVSPIHPLVKRDVQLFMKRLRDSIKPKKCRFYASGEYGDESMRPHYHLILFNYFPEDAKLLFKKNNIDYYISESISKLWNYGIHVITNVTWDTCAYTARYVLKKLNHGYDDQPEKLNYPREFSLMSRKPGIGYDFFHENVGEFFNTGYAYLPTEKGARKIMNNKYYSHLFDVDYEDFNEYRKKRVKDHALQNVKNAQISSGLCYSKLVENREENLEARTTQLRRRKEI